MPRWSDLWLLKKKKAGKGRMGEGRGRGRRGKEGGPGEGSHHVTPWSFSRPWSARPAQPRAWPSLPSPRPLLGLNGEQLPPDSAEWGHWALRSPPPGAASHSPVPGDRAEPCPLSPHRALLESGGPQGARGRAGTDGGGAALTPSSPAGRPLQLWSRPSRLVGPGQQTD